MRGAMGMRTLIAKRPVLFQGLLYQAGEQLPVLQENMVLAWLSAGSAEWVEKVQGKEEVPGSKELEKLTKEQLLEVAAQRGLDISKSATKSELVEKLLMETQL